MSPRIEIAVDGVGMFTSLSFGRVKKRKGESKRKMRKGRAEEHYWLILVGGGQHTTPTT